jgi:3-hydroxyisobutyrate dehydrogenase
MHDSGDKQKIGFIGLGVMGMPMAQHIIAAGHPVIVYDIDKAAPRRLQQKFPQVTIAGGAREVAAASEIVITMLPSGREVRETVLGDDGLLKGFKPGSLLLDTSSAEPWYTKEITASLDEVSVAMVDAPVSGAEAGAIAAELVFMTGGDPASMKRVMPILMVMGTKVFHLGPVGAGHVMKSINNLITAATFMATAEGLILGTGYGLDPAVMTKVLNVSTGMSWITKTHIAQRILNRRFDDPFKFDLMMKDINIALQVADTLNLSLPFMEAAKVLWQDIQPDLPRGSSVSELVRALEIKTGVELKSKGIP